MSTTTNDALARAIEYLHAVEVAPDRYAFRIYDDWYVSPNDDPAIPNSANMLVRQMEYRKAGGAGFEDSPVVKMPKWWSILQRTVMHCKVCNGRNGHTIAHPERIGEYECITVNLDTGEEVSA